LRDTLIPGLRHESRTIVTPAMLVPALAGQLPPFADMPAVLATAMMVGFVEATCIDLMRPHLDEGEHSVGIHIDMSHAAPTSAGSDLRAEVEVETVAGRILSFRVRAFDSAGPIGEGTHRRAVIRMSRFSEKIVERAGTATVGTGRPT